MSFPYPPQKQAGGAQMSAETMGKRPLCVIWSKPSEEGQHEHHGAMAHRVEEEELER